MTAHTLTPAEINAILTDTDFEGAKTGGCVSFAVALNTVFGAETFPCAFDPFDDSKPLHAMAVINGVVFDADGSHGTDPTYVQNWWSGLKPNDFNAVVHEYETTDKTKCEALQEHLEEHGYANFSDVDTLYNIGANQQAVDNYVQELETAIKNYKS